MSIIKLDKERLAECRKKLGITKMEAAKRMEMSQPAYLRYEAGDRTPSIHVVKTMANVLNTSVSYLLGETDDPAIDTYIVKSADDPKLFHIVELYKKNSPNTLERLKSYVNKL